MKDDTEQIRKRAKTLRSLAQYDRNIHYPELAAQEDWEAGLLEELLEARIKLARLGKLNKDVGEEYE